MEMTDSDWVTLALILAPIVLIVMVMQVCQWTQPDTDSTESSSEDCK